MFQIRLHGRGGQGVVTAAELLALAAFADGRHAQAFPSFGSERTGAPVISFCRIADRPIRRHDPVGRPDALVILDPTLLHQVDVFGGLPDSAYVLINSARTPAELHVDEALGRLALDRVRTVPASDIARAHLGRPLPNAAVLGGLAALTRCVSLDAVGGAIRQRFGGASGAANAAAAQAAYRAVRGVPGALEAAHA